MRSSRHSKADTPLQERILLVALCILLTVPPGYFTPKANATTETPRKPEAPALPLPAAEPAPAQTLPSDSTVNLDAEMAIRLPENDSIPPTEVTADDYPYGLDGKIPFNPSPTRAVWLSALCPGLGQIYNRRYWKLPIVVGGFMGLGYATAWNSNQYQDYMQAYRDLLDNDPGTNSYMDFFPPTTDESTLDKSWLERTFKSRKDSFRRYRDLCVILLAAFYLICMVDAYVDASLAHFDISPNLSMDLSPTMIQPAGGGNRAALGLNWAINF